MHKAAEFPWFNRMVVAGALCPPQEEEAAARAVLLRWLRKGSWGPSGPSRLQRELFLTKQSCLNMPGLFNPFSPKSTFHQAKCIGSR